MASLTSAACLSEAGLRTPVSARFASVPGAGISADMARGAFSFDVQFHSAAGDFELSSNNLPIRSSPRDTFWGAVAVLPERLHEAFWAMSDRAIPRSYRMMETFGVHTVRLVNADGDCAFARFHWRPVLGSAAMVWDEARRIAATDRDFHRRDLRASIDAHDFPAWDLALQIFDGNEAERIGIDVFDPSAIVPEDSVPLRIVGRLVLDRLMDDRLVVAASNRHPARVVSGIERLSPQRSAYPASAAEHYSRARQFFDSQTPPEQAHLISAFVFELRKIRSAAIRERVVGHLRRVHAEFALHVAAGLGVLNLAEFASVQDDDVTNLPALPPLSLIGKFEPTLEGRIIGCLITDGVSAASVRSARRAVIQAGARLTLIATRAGGVRTAEAGMLTADVALTDSPCVLFDAVIVLGSDTGIAQLVESPSAVDFVRDAFEHLKVIAYDDVARPLLEASGVSHDDGVIIVSRGGREWVDFVEAASYHRVWSRERIVRPNTP